MDRTSTISVSKQRELFGFPWIVLHLEVIKNNRILLYVAFAIILLPEETNKKGMEQKAMKLSK
jgi:hypothetical protein